MTMVTFDTHEFIKRLEKSGVPHEQAEAHADAQKEVQKIRAEALATKGDLVAMEERLRRELAESKAEILKWVVGMLAAQTGLIVAAFFVTARMLASG